MIHRLELSFQRIHDHESRPRWVFSLSHRFFRLTKCASIVVQAPRPSRCKKFEFTLGRNRGGQGHTASLSPRAEVGQTTKVSLLQPAFLETLEKLSRSGHPSYDFAWVRDREARSSFSLCLRPGSATQPKLAPPSVPTVFSEFFQRPTRHRSEGHFFASSRAVTAD